MKNGHRCYLYVLLGCVGLLSGCLVTRNVPKNSYLLTNQYTIGNRHVQGEELEPYYLQPTNRKLLGLPFGLWIYELGNLWFDPLKVERDYRRIKHFYDKKLAATTDPVQYKKIEQRKNQRLSFYREKLKDGNFTMRQGERPVLYSEEKRLSTEVNLRHYLHTRGYFKAKVKSKVKIKHNKATVVYFMKEKEPSILHRIALSCPDSAVSQLLEPYAEKSLLKTGQQYDQNRLVAERERIYHELHKRGYWNFNKQYIEFTIDTTSDHINLQTTVSLPSQQQAHSNYKLDQVEFLIDPLEEEQSQDTTVERGITFYHVKPHFAPAMVMGKLTLYPGQVYNRADILETKKRLIQTGIFKNVQINQWLTDEKALQTRIHAQVYDRFQLEQEIGAGITKNSPVPFYQIALVGKNLLKKLETLNIKCQIGLELGSFPTDGTKVQPIQNFQLSLGGHVQAFVLPLPSAFREKTHAYYPYTKADIAYTFTKQPNYDSRRLSTIINYGWYPRPNISLECTPLKMNLTDFNLQKPFADELATRQDKGDHTYKRYQPALYTQTSVKTVYQHIEADSTLPFSNTHYQQVEHFIENGGTLQDILPFDKIFGKELTNYQYIKSSISYTAHIPFQRKTTLVYHIYTGVLYPYNKYRIAPPEQYFFIGGPSSMRAWGPRSLGPGSYQTKQRDESNKKFVDERPGEYILQTNLELRRNLIGILGGAFFIDIGNVWMLQKTDHEGEEFLLDRFYKEIALGVGAGIFLNFNIIVLRLDAGIRVYDPGMPMADRLFPPAMFLPTINVTLGHPF